MIMNIPPVELINKDSNHTKDKYDKNNTKNKKNQDFSSILKEEQIKIKNLL